MVVTNDNDINDDDIVENYDEVTDRGDAKRVTSAIGGPVKRPDDGDRPVHPSDNIRPESGPVNSPESDGDDYADRSKGKVTKTTARNIWIICILICVVGVGLVVVDLVLDPFKRHGGGDADKSNQTAVQPVERPKQRELTPREKLERKFMTRLNEEYRKMANTKAWDFYWTAALEFIDARDKALEIKNKSDATTEQREAAWADAIKHYYKARYATELFKHKYDEDRVSMDYLPFDNQDLEAVPDEELEDPRIQTYQAALWRVEVESKNMGSFNVDVLKQDAGASRVHDSQDWADNVFGEWKTKFEASTLNKPEFAESDLEFINGPDYKEGEERMYEKYQATRSESESDTGSESDQESESESE